MTTKLKPLPIGIQTFEEIISDGYTYVDKTQDIYNLVTGGKVYFLSRPRRFGKSLLLSTLEALFQNRRELFKGLWIDSSDYKWENHPVIRIDMTITDKTSAENLKISLKDLLENIAIEHEMKLRGSLLENIFSNLILDLSKKYKQQVVVLVDEYDKPILDNITEKIIAEDVRDALRGFYSILKAQGSYIKFIFLTGVSRFSKVSIFSGLNNLKDISMDNRFAAICGYTQEELELNFQEYIDLYAEFNSGHKFNNRDELLQTIKEWYNGYRFTESETKVYNPFSTLLLFDTKQFTEHWFSTGTPSFLIDLIKEKNYNLRELTSMSATEVNLESFSIEDIPIVTTLFQTGYTTIVNVEINEMSMKKFKLDYPNKEVKSGFINYILDYAIKGEPSVNYIQSIYQAMKNNDIETCIKTFQSFFASIPYSIQEKKSSAIKQKENYYQSLIYAVFEVLGLRPQAEAQTNIGRSDMVVETTTAIYIWELKMDKSPGSAIEQIHEKKYYEKYLHLGKPIKLIGLKFSSKERNITEFKVESHT
jgi:hypothetical protein